MSTGRPPISRGKRSDSRATVSSFTLRKEEEGDLTGGVEFDGEGSTALFTAGWGKMRMRLDDGDNSSFLSSVRSRVMSRVRLEAQMER